MLDISKKQLRTWLQFLNLDETKYINKVTNVALNTSEDNLQVTIKLYMNNILLKSYLYSRADESVVEVGEVIVQ